MMFVFKQRTAKEPMRGVLQPAILIAAVCAMLVFPATPAYTAPPFAGQSLAPMLERAMPAVVGVESEATVKVPQRRVFPHPFFEFFGERMPQQPYRERKRAGTGSGVIIDAEKGYVITNHHVIAGADSVVVMLNDGRRYDAEVLGSDPETDISILRIDADDITEMKLGDSDNLRVGDYVFAIGSPFGLSQSVTSGIVSALGRSGLGIESYEDFIQTDASINRGNSGGALININGELIGINTAILGSSGNGGNIGIGFAIPINMAVGVTEQLLEYGHVKRGQLGIVIQALTPELAKAFDVERSAGIVIAQVRPDSPAEKAGLELGDVILSVNGRPVKNHHQMRSYIGLRRIGERVVMEVLRDGEEIEVTAVITEPEMRNASGEKLNRKFAGVLLENFTPSRTGEPAGVLVKDIRRSSHAYDSGLRQGDIIISINRKPVLNLEQLRQAVSVDRSTLAVLVKRKGRRIFLGI